MEILRIMVKIVIKIWEILVFYKGGIVIYNLDIIVILIRVWLSILVRVWLRNSNRLYSSRNRRKNYSVKFNNNSSWGNSKFIMTWMGWKKLNNRIFNRKILRIWLDSIRSCWNLITFLLGKNSRNKIIRKKKKSWKLDWRSENRILRMWRVNCSNSKMIVFYCRNSNWRSRNSFTIIIRAIRIIIIIIRLLAIVNIIAAVLVNRIIGVWIWTII